MAKTALSYSLVLAVKMNDGTNGFTFMHQIESIIDLIQAHGVRNEVIEGEFTIHITLYDAR